MCRCGEFNLLGSLHCCNGHSPIADTAPIYTTYDAEVTRLRSVTLSVVAVIAGPCQECSYV